VLPDERVAIVLDDPPHAIGVNVTSESAGPSSPAPMIVCGECVTRRAALLTRRLPAYMPSAS
jgi:hypothetical protein